MDNLERLRQEFSKDSTKQRKILDKVRKLVPKAEKLKQSLGGLESNLEGMYRAAGDFWAQTCDILVDLEKGGLTKYLVERKKRLFSSTSMRHKWLEYLAEIYEVIAELEKTVKEIHELFKDDFDVLEQAEKELEKVK